MYAGHSTGKMGIVDPREQALVYRTLAALGFTGVLAVHCEKEDLLRPAEWDPVRPVTHARARPPAAEVASVHDQKTFATAARFHGTLHVCHISTPWALDLLRGTHEEDKGAEPPAYRVTCGLTPHHALLDANMMEQSEGLLLKVNPPLRPLPMPALMLQRLQDGDIDWIETDHAPHTRRDKLESFASGFPGFAFYPRFVTLLAQRGIAAARIRELTHDAICRTFNVDIRAAGRKPEIHLRREYEFDAFDALIS
jgi:dihydroorotase